MHQELIQYLLCPNCRLSLNMRSVRKKTGEIYRGILYCNRNHSFQVNNGIPRFVKEHYSESFGMQWNIHVKTQIDKFNGTNISKERFYRETNWSSKELKGKILLDAGSGAGRFTQIALDAGAIVFSVDSSSAVEANKSNNLPNNNLYIIQADILNLPFPKEFFDYIICLGVLQHTPDPEKTFKSLLPYLKSKGEITIDIYPKKFKYLIHPKYFLRPITRRMPKKTLYCLIKALVPIIMPISTQVRKVPIIGSKLSQAMLIANYTGLLPLNKQQLLEWAIMDTFDMLSPKYDKPQTKKIVKKWFQQNNFEKYEVIDMGGFISRGKKK